MDRKKLYSITVNAPDSEKPILNECCPNLKIVFLQDNFLTSIGNAFQGLKNVTQINLYNNLISDMDIFDDCVNLRKLYMENNRISLLAGLRNCQRLEELYLGNQQIGNKQFSFDEYSLAAISNTMEVLDLPAVNLVTCKPLYFLERLITLNLNDNLIDNFDEQVVPMLMTLQNLRNLNMHRNPVVKNTPKFRDQVILLTRPQFTELDGKTIKA